MKIIAILYIFLIIVAVQRTLSIPLQSLKAKNVISSTKQVDMSATRVSCTCEFAAELCKEKSVAVRKLRMDAGSTNLAYAWVRRRVACRQCGKSCGEAKRISPGSTISGIFGARQASCTDSVPVLTPGMNELFLNLLPYYLQQYQDAAQAQCMPISRTSTPTSTATATATPTASPTSNYCDGIPPAPPNSPA